ncbi:MAG TPA: PIN domain-containing protein [Schlesneria sp.]
MIFVVIDSCVFHKVWTQSSTGCEVDHLTSLGKLVDEGTVSVVVPEVIILELQRQWRSFHRKVKDDIAKRKASIVSASTAPKQGTFWNEVDSITPDIAKSVDDWEPRFLQACEQRQKQVDDFLKSTRVRSIPFTQEIMFQAKRLMISGAMPKTERADQDAFIIQSIIQSLEGDAKTGDFLYFCSQNMKDFTVEIDSGPALRIGVQERLPKSSFFSDLKSLVLAAREHVPPPEPDAAKVQDAEDREEALRETLQSGINAGFGSGSGRGSGSGSGAGASFSPNLEYKFAGADQFKTVQDLQSKLAAAGMFDQLKTIQSIQDKLAGAGMFDQLKTVQDLQTKLAAAGAFDQLKTVQSIQDKLAGAGVFDQLKAYQDLQSKLAAAGVFDQLKTVQDLQSRLATGG